MMCFELELLYEIQKSLEVASILTSIKCTRELLKFVVLFRAQSRETQEAVVITNERRGRTYLIIHLRTIRSSVICPLLESISCP